MENQTKIITVYPLVSGNGAKFIATNIAHYLKGLHTAKKIALVDLNLKQPYLAHALTAYDEIHGIDNLIDKIDGNLLSNELFVENMVSMKNNVELLKGTKMIGKHKVFTERHVKSIIEHLRNIYDYVIIAVAPEIDNAGTVLSLHEADTIITVGRNNVANEKTADNALHMIQHYKKTNEPVKMVYNMYVSGSTGLADFVKDNSLEVIGLVEFEEQSTDNLNLMANQSVKFFKQKSRNEETFTNMVKTL